MDFIFQDLTRAFAEANLHDLIRISAANIVNEYWSENNFLAELNKKWEYSFAVISDGRIAAFLIASEKDESVHIHKFVVDQPFQKKGLGSLMMAHALKRITHKPITLKVQDHNPNAVSFYLAKGFKIVGHENDLYSMIYTQ